MQTGIERGRWRRGFRRTGLISVTAAALIMGTVPASFALSSGSKALPAHRSTAKPADSGLVPSQTGKFVLSEPTRVLDTRVPIGVTNKAPVRSGGVVKLKLGLPADATAVVLNLTVTHAKSAGFLTIYPDGSPQPASSNLNFAAGETRANLSTVAVSDGSVDIANHSSSADLVADLVGYYTNDAATAGTSYYPVNPARLLDTRSTHSAISAGSLLPLQVTGRMGVPDSNVSAVVLNVTEADATVSGFFTVFAAGRSRPGVSNLNFTKGSVVPNLVTVPVGTDGKVDIYNNAGRTDAVVDVEGYYTGNPQGSGFIPVPPTRIKDTRTLKRPLAAKTSMAMAFDTVPGIPATGTAAVVLNVTSVNATEASYFSVYPDGATRPAASSVNFRPKQVASNLVVVPVGADGKVDVYNNAGRSDLVVDIFGYFAAPQGAPTDLTEYGANGTQACATSAPGPWVAASESGAGGTPQNRQVVLTANVTQPAGVQDYTLEGVVTGPGGVQVYDSEPTQGISPLPISFYLDGLPSGSYSWYAVSSYNGTTSPASAPCYFQVDADTVVTGVTATLDPATDLHTGMSVQITLAATATGTSGGKDIAGFCYAWSQAPAADCTLTPAVNGKLVFDTTLTGWGSQTLYVYADTVSGWRGAGMTQFYVAS